MPDKAESPRQRILRTASDLFDRQGYAATGINQIIREAEVAKATFYTNFPSKGELGTAWLEMRSRAWINRMRTVVKAETEGRACVRALFDALEAWLVEVDYRGCPFLNTLAELPGRDDPMHDPICLHMKELRKLFRSVPGIDSAAADRVFVNFYGAMALAPAVHDPWPVHAARDASEELVGS